MTNIECTKCGDVVEVTADTVVLPFVCMSCEDAIAKFTQEFVPPAPVTDEQAEVAAFYEKMAPESETTEPEEEFATVENTTLLIADLEEQLRQERILSDSLKLRIENGEEKNTQLLIEKNRQADTIRTRGVQIENQAKTIASYENDIDGLLDKQVRSNVALQFLKAVIYQLGKAGMELRKEVDTLKTKVVSEQRRTEIEKMISQMNASSANGYASQAADLRYEIDQLNAEIDTLKLNLKCTKEELATERRKSLWTRFVEQWRAEAKRAAEENKDYYGEI
jgi:hypothetical protein